MSHFETNVPKEIENLLHHLFDIWRNSAPALPVQKHDIDVAEWIELTAAVSAEGDECQRRFTRTGFFSSCGGRGRKGISQQNIDEIDPACANFPATAASLMI